jgi:transcriptional regulator
VIDRQRAYRRRLQAQAAAERLERATDRAVLRLRKQGWTLARIGAALGVSRQRVHQIERRARSLLAKHSAQVGPPLPGS